jgi:NAD(P)H-flavin reductase
VRLTLNVREVVRVTPRAVLLRLDLTGARFPFEAGQAVMAGLTGRDARKPYAIACAPSLAARLQMLELLARVDPSSPEPHLEDVAAGSALDVEGPFGSVTLPPASDRAPLLLVAGGTGIAPLRSMLWEALLRAPAVPVTLAYSARTREDLAFAEELSALEEAGRLRLVLTTTRDAAAGGRHGRIDAALLAQWLPGPGARCYVCGPDEFVRDITDVLVSLSVPSHRIARD